MEDFFDFLTNEESTAHTGSTLVRVISLIGDVILECELSFTTTVADVKDQIWRTKGVPVGEQQLVLLAGGAAPLQDRESIDRLTGETEGPVELSMVRVDRHLALSWSADRSIRLWDITSGALVHDFGGHLSSSVPVGVDIDPTWKHALSWGGAMTMRLWDLQEGVSLRTLFDSTRMKVSGMNVDWPSNRALSWGTEPWLQLWDLDSSMCRELRGHVGSVLGAEVSWARDRAVSWGNEDLFLWDLRLGAVEHSLRDLPGIRLCSVDPDWARALVGSASGTLRLWDWDMDGSVVVVELPAHITGVPESVVEWDLMRGLSWDVESGMLCLWNELGPCQTHRVPGLFAVHASWDQDCAVTWSVQQLELQVQVWDIGRESNHLRPRDRSSKNTCRVGQDVEVQVDWPRLRALTWGRGHGALQLWDLSLGALAQELCGHAAEVHGLSVDWELDRALSWSGVDSTLRLWGLDRGAPLRVMRREAVGPFGVQVDWGQNCILTWTMHRCFRNDNNYTLEFWDLGREEPAKVLPGHTDVVKGAAMASEKARFCHRAPPAEALISSMDKNLGGSASTELSERLLASYVSGNLDGLIAKYHAVLRTMPTGVEFRGGVDGAPRVSGEPLPSGAAYVPMEDSRGRVRLIMYGTATTRGAPSAMSAPVCTAVAQLNATRLWVENAGWFGLFSMALARPQDYHTGYGAVPLPTPADCRCEYASVLLGTNDAMMIAGSDAYIHVNYVASKNADFPRLPADWKARCRPSPELYEHSLKTVVQELTAAGTRVALCTPPPLGEEVEDTPPKERHVQRSPFRVVSELARAVRRVAASEGCDVLPLFECCTRLLRERRKAGRRLVPWAPKVMFELQQQCHMVRNLGKFSCWDEILPEPYNLALSHDMVHMNETCASIYAALVQSWLDAQLRDI